MLTETKEIIGFLSENYDVIIDFIAVSFGKTISFR